MHRSTLAVLAAAVARGVLEAEPSSSTRSATSRAARRLRADRASDAPHARRRPAGADGRPIDPKSDAGRRGAGAAASCG